MATNRQSWSEQHDRAHETALLGDRYELGDRLGRGGQATVFRAYNRVLDRRVAVKVLRELTDDPAGRERFVQEAHLLARLNHPHLVKVLDACYDGSEPFLVLELVDGSSLATRCAQQRMDPEQVACLAEQLCGALLVVQAAGLVHRDVRPANVLLRSDDDAVLSDFGVARLMFDAPSHTAVGFTVGSAAYLSPEQLVGKRVTPAADVYSLGLTLIEALTGCPAYTGTAAEAAMARLATPPDIAAWVPQPWRTLLEAMTNRAPETRLSLAELSEQFRLLRTPRKHSTGTAMLPVIGAGKSTRHSDVASDDTIVLPIGHTWHDESPEHRTTVSTTQLSATQASAAIAATVVATLPDPDHTPNRLADRRNHGGRSAALAVGTAAAVTVVSLSAYSLVRNGDTAPNLPGLSRPISQGALAAPTPAPSIPLGPSPIATPSQTVQPLATSALASRPAVHPGNSKGKATNGKRKASGKKGGGGKP